MPRYKKLLSHQVALRYYNAQVGEALARVKGMSNAIRLSLPVRYRIE